MFKEYIDLALKIVLYVIIPLGIAFYIIYRYEHILNDDKKIKNKK